MKTTEEKTVQYNGEMFIVGFTPYAYSDSRFVINREKSSITIPNENILNIEIFKKEAKNAIKEYIDRRIANNNFKAWDGKLD